VIKLDSSQYQYIHFEEFQMLSSHAAIGYFFKTFYVNNLGCIYIVSLSPTA